MIEHELYSPSRHPMLAQCPGWISGPSGDAAERGTRIHKIIETFLKGTNDGLIFNEDEIESASRAIEWFNGPLAQRHPGMQWQFEHKLQGKLPDTGGTLDAVAVTTPDDFMTECVGIDWKSGASSYDAATNEQAHIHVINMAEKWGVFPITWYFFNCDTGQESGHTYTRDDIPRIEAEAEARIAMSQACARTGLGLRRFYGCNWCGRKEGCPEYRKSVETAVAAPIIDTKLMTPQDIGTLLDRYDEPAGAIAEFIKGLKARAKELIDSGVAVPGWRTSQRAGQRKWKDAASPGLLAAKIEENMLDWVTPAEAERRMKKMDLDPAILVEYTVQPTNTILTKDRA